MVILGLYNIWVWYRESRENGQENGNEYLGVLGFWVQGLWFGLRSRLYMLQRFRTKGLQMTFEDQVPSCGGLRHQTQWSQSQWCVYLTPPYRQIRIHGLQGNVALKPRLVNQDRSLFVIIVLSAGAVTLSVQELKYDSLKY